MFRESCQAFFSILAPPIFWKVFWLLLKSSESMPKVKTTTEIVGTEHVPRTTLFPCSPVPRGQLRNRQQTAFWRRRRFPSSNGRFSDENKKARNGHCLNPSALNPQQHGDLFHSASPTAVSHRLVVRTACQAEAGQKVASMKLAAPANSTISATAAALVTSPSLPKPYPMNIARTQLRHVESFTH